MIGFRAFKHLLPRARAWRLTVDGHLRRFFLGLSGIADDGKDFVDGVYDDMHPETTRELSAWEDQFALPSAAMTEQQRRDRLAATWKALGGQDPQYLQDTLQAAGFDVYVHEWWEYDAAQPGGGSVNGATPPTRRNPFQYLQGGPRVGHPYLMVDGGADAQDAGEASFDGSTSQTGLPFLMVDGGADAQDGDSIAQDGSTATPPGYALVNRILVASDEVICDGDARMQDGGAPAQDGTLVTVFGYKAYSIPLDPAAYPYFLYIGGETFPDQATVPTARQEEFEALCLKLCPTEQWLGALITYT